MSETRPALELDSDGVPVMLEQKARGRNTIVAPA